jgi:hypothetical protein
MCFKKFFYKFWTDFYPQLSIFFCVFFSNSLQSPWDKGCGPFEQKKHSIKNMEKSIFFKLQQLSSIFF